jgi:catechol 2,3-dioxygenase-like lactoylglutathione lyase family enzyme
MASTQTELRIEQIGQIAINVKDVKRATAFYRDTLGLNFLFDTGALSFFDCGGVRLMLGVAEKAEFDHPSSVIYYRVPDIKEAFKTLSTRGAKFEDEPHIIARLPEHDLWMTFFRDSEDNLLALMSEVPKSAATTWWRPGSVDSE